MSHAGSMFWILSSTSHGDFDDYTIYTDAFNYPHNPQPVVPLPGNPPCTAQVVGTARHPQLSSYNVLRPTDTLNIAYCCLHLWFMGSQWCRYDCCIRLLQMLLPCSLILP